jgi:hypothetical protein
MRWWFLAGVEAAENGPALDPLPGEVGGRVVGTEAGAGTQMIMMPYG